MKKDKILAIVGVLITVGFLSIYLGLKNNQTDNYFTSLISPRYLAQTSDPQTYCINAGGRWLTSTNTCEMKNFQGCWPSTEFWCSYQSKCLPQGQTCSSNTTTLDSQGCNTSTQFWCAGTNSCLANGTTCGPILDSQGCNTSTQFWCAGTNSCLANGTTCGPTLDSHGCNTSTQFWCIATNACLANGTTCGTSSGPTLDSHGCNTSTQFWCVATNACLANGTACGTSTSTSTSPQTQCTSQGGRWDTVNNRCEPKNINGCWEFTENWCPDQRVCVPKGQACSGGITSGSSNVTSGAIPTTPVTSGQTSTTQGTTTTPSTTTSGASNTTFGTTTNTTGTLPAVTSTGSTAIQTGLLLPPPPTNNPQVIELQKQLQLIDLDLASVQKRYASVDPECKSPNCQSERRTIDTRRISILEAIKKLSPSPLPVANPNQPANQPFLPDGGAKDFPTLPGQLTKPPVGQPGQPIINTPGQLPVNVINQKELENKFLQKEQIIGQKMSIFDRRFTPVPIKPNKASQPNKANKTNKTNQPSQPAGFFIPPAPTQTETLFKEQLSKQCNDDTCSYFKFLDKTVKPEDGNPAPELSVAEIKKQQNEEQKKNDAELEKQRDENDKWSLEKLKEEKGWEGVKEERNKLWSSFSKDEDLQASSTEKIEQKGATFLNNFISTNAFLAQANSDSALTSGDSAQSIDQSIQEVTKKIEDLSKILEERTKELTELQEKIKDKQVAIQQKTEEIATKVEAQVAEFQQQKEAILEKPVRKDVVLDKKDTAIINPGLQEVLKRVDDDEEQDILMKIDEKDVKSKAGLIKNFCKDINLSDTGYISGRCAAANILALTQFLNTETTKIESDEPMFLGLDKSTTLIGSLFVNKDMGLTGKKIKVAVLDSGINSDHPALKNKVIKSIDFTGEGETDLNGHGTHVAGIIASNDGIYHGNAPDAEILNVKVMNKDGAGKMSYAIQGIQWAVDNGAQVINISLGAPLDNCDGQDSLSLAAADAIAKGVIVIAAAGNFGPDAKTIASPGCSQNVITVGAIDDDSAVATFSSRGPTSDDRQKPDILAPGVSIVSSWYDGNYASLSGTSQAAPHVAGIVALLLEADPKLTPAQMKQVLVSTADPLQKITDNVENQGIINAYTAASQYVEVKKTVSSTVGEEVVSQKTDEEKAAQAKQEANQTIVIVEKEVKTFTEARQNFRLCVIESQGSQEAKDACMKVLLKAQVNLQKNRLTQEEKNNISMLEQKALEINKLSADYDGQTANDLKAIASVFFYTTFVGDYATEIIDISQNFLEDVDNGKNIENLIKNIKKKYFEIKDKSEFSKYERNLIPFKDVGDRVWYFIYVNEIKDQNVIGGYRDANGNPTGEYGPGNTLTVAEALRIALEASKKGKSSDPRQPKNLSAAGHWAKQYFLKAEDINLSLVANAGDNPNRAISRAEVVKLLIESFDIAKLPVYEAIFKDVPNTSADADSIYTGFGVGIISGDSTGGTFRPNDPINRAEMAKMVVETLDVTK